MKTETTRIPGPPPFGLVVLAFAIVYVIWGSTYLGIRYAVESIPPFLMAATRHLCAGVLLFGFARLRGAARPSGIEWRDAAIAGALMLVVGNGGVTWAEQYISSGVTALLVALVPIWMVLFDWLRPQGVRPRPLVILGLAVGFIGVALLAGRQMNGTGSNHALGVAALMASSVCWAFGSIFNRTARKPASPFLGVAMQMIAGGAILLVLTYSRGEWEQFSFQRMTTLSFGAWLYLTVAGSLIAYTAYVWLLHATTPARVATYAYVNPLIAVLLGCTLGRETFTADMLLAWGLVIGAVVLVLRGGSVKPTPESQCEEVG